MKKIILILILSAFFASCNSSKRVVSKKTRTSKTTKKRNSSPSAATPKTVVNIIEHAKTFEGTRYKYGGTTKKGMDCSGLVVTAFKKEDILLPRTTSDLSKRGDWIDVKEVKEGDLLFFATKKNNRRVNHVGIVTSSRPGHVEFIHASTSRGVMISNLAESYWYLAYVQARRVL
ncbi:NlpC/P60 family protein [Psychroserpens burtonensis]|uniref:NlpC/P60 family protein n=1 Tax=Psychroserpens burtonensis TaxID=49278 RepID=A0A5C7BDX2_9FLAO|nr:C40 family peptidase [Psychroserpens burtonensis]TXE18899.1 NlpC/P60 family protein [Psychroserpens burtonensis]